jgi:hypothetical protein
MKLNHLPVLLQKFLNHYQALQSGKFETELLPNVVNLKEFGVC